MAYEYAKKLGYDGETFVMLALQSALDKDKLPFEISFKHKRKDSKPMSKVILS